MEDTAGSSCSGREQTYAFFLNQIVQFLRDYSWLIDSLNIQFFTDDLWSKLPESWQSSLNNASSETLTEILDPKIQCRCLKQFSTTGECVAFAPPSIRGDLPCTGFA
eukprot:m.180738 g.180738  ORF g.180738 m.180738 type:complete len:107 (+) comp39260_c0_seq7:247-567(+)